MTYIKSISLSPLTKKEGRFQVYQLKKEKISSISAKKKERRFQVYQLKKRERRFQVYQLKKRRRFQVFQLGETAF